MKTVVFFKKLVAFGVVLFTINAVHQLHAGELTAFALVKEGNKHIGENSKDKVVQIRSEKSVASLTPNIWYVVYYDEYATMKAVEVKFSAGRVDAIKRPFRLLEKISEKDAELYSKNLKVDSDKALKTALKENILENLKVTSTRMKLDRFEDIPAWRITLWASKIKNPKSEANIGDIFVDVENGKVIKTDIKPSRVD